MFNLLNSEEKRIVEKFFHIVNERSENMFIKEANKWMGIGCVKYPTDLWNYYEIIYNLKPDVIIETGTAYGGSALFFSDMMSLCGIDRNVITVDIEPTNRGNIGDNKGIRFLVGSSIDNDIINSISSFINKEQKIMVVLDSNHQKDHVLNEMILYSKLVTVGQYMVVEDGGINGHPVLPGWGDGPYEAINDYMRSYNNDNFKIDKSREERFVFSCFPNGWLLRIK